MLLSRLPRMPAKTGLRVEMAVGIDYRRDLDNVIKPVMDALADAGVIPDDRYVDVIEARRDQSVDGVKVGVDTGG